MNNRAPRKKIRKNLRTGEFVTGKAVSARRLPLPLLCIPFSIRCRVESFFAIIKIWCPAPMGKLFRKVFGITSNPTVGRG
jgi:hypothetical protein